jgi:transposase-like protein
MQSNLQNPIFQSDEKARQWLEARVWPNGPVCPHCGTWDQAKITALQGKAHRPGLYQCNECREQFTVTVRTVFERSKIPLSKWLAALFLMIASKKGVSAHQVHRSLGISYKSTWFMMHRLREAMRSGGFEPLGGEGKVVEADETYYGKAELPQIAKDHGHKYLKGTHRYNNRPIVALVERGGPVRTFHVPVADAASVAQIVRANIKRESRLHTDESKLYRKVGSEFVAHETVRHTANEYIRGDVTTNAVETTSQSSSAECAASTSIAARSICTAIWPSSIFATTIAPHQA